MNSATNKPKKIRISDAQMAALETAGVFEVDPDLDDGLDVLRRAIVGNYIVTVSDEVASALTDLANGADECAYDHRFDRETAKMYRADSRALTTLSLKVRRAAAQ